MDAWTGERVPGMDTSQDGWTQLRMAPAAAMLAAARSTGLSLLAHMPLAAPVAKTRRGRHDGAPRLVALTGWRHITERLPALLCRRMDATTDQLGPVADPANRAVRLAASVCVWDMQIPSVILSLY